MVIAIDGVAGAGKSVVAKQISEKTNFIAVHSGDIYRAIAYKFKLLKMNEINNENLKKVIKNINLKLEFEDKNQKTILDEKNVNELIHTAEISKLTSKISSYMGIRNAVNKIQKRIAKNFDVVIEGRDIGTVVFPNAEIKIFLTASSIARAERRFKDFEKAGNNILSVEEIKKAIEDRDFVDMNRKNCPLICAQNAIIIDSSDLTIQEVVQIILNEINKRK